MNNFLNIHTNQLLTPTSLKLTTGIEPEDLDLVFKAGYAVVDYVFPQFDNTFYTTKQKPELTKIDEQHYTQEFDIVYLPIEQIKKNIKEKITNLRWQMETGGITLPNNIKISTGIEDQNRIITSIQGMESAGINEINFKAESGWVKLTLDELKNISIIIIKHVEECFNYEFELHTMCDDATTIEELKRIIDEELNMNRNKTEE